MRPYPPDLPRVPEPPDLAADRIEEARLEAASLAGERRLGFALLDCELRDCDLANLDGRGGDWRRVLVDRGRLTGCNLAEARLLDVVFAGCRANLVALSAATLDRVAFESCDLSESGFAGARLHTVTFEDCDLRRADFSGARFEAVEMRGCKLDGLRGAAGMAGVRMPWPDVLENAGLFAGACGVGLLD